VVIVMKVLHIENSDLIKCIVKKIVENAQMEYFTLSKVAGEYAYPKKTDFDLIITAIENVDANGFYPLSKEDGLENLVPVLVVSAQDSLEVRSKLFSMGIVDYIKKDQDFQRRLSIYLETFVSSKRYSEQLKHKKICIIDDSNFDLQVMKKLLWVHKARHINCFESFEQAYTSGLDYDIFIVDLVLRGDSGEVVISRIKEKYPEAIIILVTGSGNYSAVSHLLMYGADDCVFKPFSSQVFLTRIKNQIRAKEALRDLKNKNLTLEKMLRYDHLTSIYNRKTILNIAKRLAYSYGNHSKQHAMVMVDIDDFKTINDTFGHMEGDKVISSVAEIIKSSISSEDSVGRYGGEEFLVILQDTDMERAIKTAEHIRRNIASASFELDTEKKITVSGGLTLFTDNWTQALDQADQKLFVSKRAGKNRITK